MNPQIEMKLKEVSYQVASQNELKMEVVMDVCVTNFQNREVSLFQKIEESSEELPKLPSFTVYYVKSGDTLWNIAKKYRVTVDSLKEVNELKDDFIYPGEQLIIPKYRKVEAFWFASKLVHKIWKAKYKVDGDTYDFYHHLFFYLDE